MEQILKNLFFSSKKEYNINMNKFRLHFPADRTKTKTYLKVFLPIMLGSILFALNGVVDNFMVGDIHQGQPALGVVNSWTTIITGVFLGTAAGGSVVMSQFYHAKKYETAKEIARYRFWLSITASVLFAIVAWTAPDTLIRVFYHDSWTSKDGKMIIDNARVYLKIIAFQWILVSITFNMGNVLRELGHGKIPMIWGVGTLTANMTLNAILMYGFHMGVEGAAYASIAGRFVALSVGSSYLYFKKIKVAFNPFSILRVSWETRKLFWKRWAYILSISTAVFFVTARNIFYNDAFPVDGTLGQGIKGVSILALTASIMSVFTTAFNALSAMAARFVGSELGKGNLKQARINSDELKGFNTVMAALTSLILIVFASFVPNMDFLVRGKTGLDAHRLLFQVRNSLYVIAFFYPMWIWFSTSYRNGSSGGKGKWFAFADWIISGPIQIGWIALLAFGVVPNSSYMSANFFTMYGLFFLSDIIKLVVQELLYYKTKWLHSLTQEEEQENEDASKDNSEISSLIR